MRRYAIHLYWRKLVELKIYIDRIKEGQTETFEGTLPSSPLLPTEPDLWFDPTVHISGKAYLAGDHVILQLSAKVVAWIPCAICNQPTATKLELADVIHTEPLTSFVSGIFDFSPVLREEILLEIPRFVECSAGKCPERAFIQKYLKSTNNTSTHAQFPFSNL